MSQIKCCNCGNVFTPVKIGTKHKFMLKNGGTRDFIYTLIAVHSNSDGVHWSVSVFRSISEENELITQYNFPHKHNLTDMVLDIFGTTEYTKLE